MPQWSSADFKSRADERLVAERAGRVKPQADVAFKAEITWGNKDCKGGGAPYNASARMCPHASAWLYTEADAYLGRECSVSGAVVLVGVRMPAAVLLVHCKAEQRCCRGMCSVRAFVVGGYACTHVWVIVLLVHGTAVE